MGVKDEAKRVLDHLRRHIGPEAMAQHNHTQERYEALLWQIRNKGTFNAKQAADIMIKMLDAQWANLKE